MRLLNRLQHFFEKLTYVIKIFSLHWFNINTAKEYYPMSWSISNKVLDSMKVRLHDQAKLETVINGLNKFFKSEWMK
jgi:hypothetical protein